MNQTQIDRESLLALANEMIADHKDYFSGLVATDVEQKGDLLIFKGDYFLDDRGLPGEKSTVSGLTRGKEHGSV